LSIFNGQVALYDVSVIESRKTGSQAEGAPQKLNQGPFRLSMNRLLTLAALVILFVIFSIFANNFFTVRSVLNLLVQTSTFVILSVGATLVLVVGGIDFSIGAVVALGGTAAVVFAGLGVPIGEAMIAAVCLSGMIGLANGFLVARIRLPSFLTTFGMATLIYGILGGLSSILGVVFGFLERISAVHPRPFYVPDSLGDLANNPVFTIYSQDATGASTVVFPGISWIVIIMVFVAVFFHLGLTKTRVGRYFYLTGSNQEASRLSGIQVIRVRIMAYVLTSMLAGLSGVLLASRMGGPPGGAVGYEIIGIASAMIGGASLSGGAGSVGGTVIGVFLLCTLSMGLTMLNNSNPSIPILLNGIVILGSVYLEQIRHR
jgi:ribose transport system permease protein